ncbi:hypothetical protein ACIQM3_19105 [Streptomyces sp. NPDC091271]|uniref:hypothetical protein n=1 Tax=Streptomyces sp. NPDC091271 TaxID=3365980 RepID=UPI00382920DE
MAEPVAGLILGGVFALFRGSLLLPPRIRDRRSVVAVDIRPRPRTRVHRHEDRTSWVSDSG